MTASASALSIGSWPQISRYAGRCVVRKTRFSPQTKYAPDITRKPRWRSAWASVSRIVVFASATITGSLSEAPAQNAAGSIAAARAAKKSDTLAELQASNPEILTNPDKLSAAIYLRPGTALAPRLQPVIEALRSAGLSEPMVAALLDRANGSTSG